VSPGSPEFQYHNEICVPGLSGKAFVFGRKFSVKRQLMKNTANFTTDNPFEIDVMLI
jgi:hypothetical protein